VIPQRDEARALTGKILGLSRAKEALVRLEGSARGHTRFANNGVTTSGAVQDARVSVTSVFGRRHASAVTNLLDDASLAETVRRSEELARLAPEDPDWMPVLPEQEYPAVEGYDEPLARLSAEDRTRVIHPLVRRAGQRGLVASGFLEHEASAVAVATSRGLFAHQALTGCSFSTTARTRDGTGSGWAGTDAGRLADLDAERMGRTALDKAKRSASPREIEPGRMTVILEPQAVADLVQALVPALDARQADEGRSVFSRPGGGNRIGDSILSPLVDLHSDPTRRDLAAVPFDDEGQPAQKVVWFERGELRHLALSRTWAARRAARPTGPIPNLVIPGGADSLESMIRGTERGILVTRFWYIRMVDPKTLLLTGITRDGTFRVEKGAITGPVRNLRFNESPITMLRNVEKISAPRRVASRGLPMAMPAVLSHEFRFSSVSEAV
jgi:predicted Zn-dependent protease